MRSAPATPTVFAPAPAVAFAASVLVPSPAVPAVTATPCPDAVPATVAETSESGALTATPTPTPLPTEIPADYQGRWGMTPEDCTGDAAAAGRDPDDVYICVAAPAYVTDGSEEAHAHARDQLRWFGGMVGNHVADIVSRYGEGGGAVPQALTDYIKSQYGGQQLAIVSPDAGRIKVAERWSARLGGVPLAFIHKTRDINQANTVVANRVVGDVKGKICVLTDDIIDTAGTVVSAADLLLERGASEVLIAATHGLLSGPAVDRLKNSPATEIIVTNTLPLSPDREFDKLTTLSIAPLLARAIQEVFEDGSVTSMFDGHA